MPGLAHFISKWAVCGLRCKINLTSALFENRNAVAVVYLLNSISHVFSSFGEYLVCVVPVVTENPLPKDALSSPGEP